MFVSGEEKKRKKKEVFTWCDIGNFLKEKYPVLFMESWGCFVVAVVSCELFYRSAWRFPLESGRQCLDTENISIGDESSREDGAHSQTCLQQGQGLEQLWSLFSLVHLPSLTSSVTKWCFPAPDVMAKRELHWVCPGLWLFILERVFQSLWVHPGVCFVLFWADLAPPFTVPVCKPTLVGCLNSVCWHLCKLPVNLWIVFLCMIQNAAEGFQASPLSLSTEETQCSVGLLCFLHWH